MKIDISITVSNDNDKMICPYHCDYLEISEENEYLNRIIEDAKRKFGQELGEDGIKIKIKVIGW